MMMMMMMMIIIVIPLVALWPRMWIDLVCVERENERKKAMRFRLLKSCQC